MSEPFWEQENDQRRARVNWMLSFNRFTCSDWMPLQLAQASADRLAREKLSVFVFITLEGTVTGIQTAPRKGQQREEENEGRLYRVGWWTSDGNRGGSEAMGEEEARRSQAAHRKEDHRTHAVVQEWRGDQ